LDTLNIYWLNPPPKTEVIVADLGWMNFNTYCKEYNWIPPIIDWEEYNEVEEVVSHIIENKTNVLCVSTYVWNYVLIDAITKRVKELDNDIVIIRGGPHQGYNDTFFDENPQIDYLCYATGHGEVFLKEALKQIQKYGSIIFPNNVPFLISRTYKSTDLKSKFEYLKESSLQHNIQYLADLSVTAKIKHKQSVMPFELSRGCPYSCTYCEWGGGTGTKVSKKPFEVLKSDIDLICYLQFSDVEIIDANFGIFPQDIDALNYFIDHRRKTGFPKSVMCYGLAKVKPEKKEQILDAMFKDGLATTYSMSLQSISPEVLAVSKRTDITTDDQIRLAKKYIDEYDAKIKVEIIMGMPGTTIDIFYEECDLYQVTNTWYCARNVLCLLPDTEASSKEYREKYKILSSFVGSYENEESIHYEPPKGVITKFTSAREIITGSYSYTQEEWKEMFFMNKAQRIIGPLINPNKKASVVLREVYKLIKTQPWFIPINNMLADIISGDMQDKDINMVDGVFIEKIVEDNLNEFKHLVN
jgi:putative methyltransferase